MTNKEEALDWLYRLRSEIYVFMPKEWLIPMNSALDVAIKALEQQDVLDKIRAEIEKERDAYGKWSEAERWYAYDECLDIIDRWYTAESEGKK